MQKSNTRPESFALVTHATKLYHILCHVRDMFPDDDGFKRLTCNLLADSMKNAILDIERAVPRIEEAPGDWRDKWSIFGYQLALGVHHTSNMAYLVLGGIVHDGADDRVNQDTIEQLTNIRKMIIVIGNAALEENPPLMVRK